MQLERHKLSIDSRKDEWKKFKKNNPKIAINVLYAKKENYHPVTRLFVILRGMTSNYNGNFY